MAAAEGRSLSGMVERSRRHEPAMVTMRTPEALIGSDHQSPRFVCCGAGCTATPSQLHDLDVQHSSDQEIFCSRPIAQTEDGRPAQKGAAHRTTDVRRSRSLTSRRDSSECRAQRVEGAFENRRVFAYAETRGPRSQPVVILPDRPATWRKETRKTARMRAAESNLIDNSTECCGASAGAIYFMHDAASGPSAWQSSSLHTVTSPPIPRPGCGGFKHLKVFSRTEPSCSKDCPRSKRAELRPFGSQRPATARTHRAVDKGCTSSFEPTCTGLGGRSRPGMVHAASDIEAEVDLLPADFSCGVHLSDADQPRLRNAALAGQRSTDCDASDLNMGDLTCPGELACTPRGSCDSSAWPCTPRGTVALRAEVSSVDVFLPSRLAGSTPRRDSTASTERRCISQPRWQAAPAAASEHLHRQRSTGDDALGGAAASDGETGAPLRPWSSERPTPIGVNRGGTDRVLSRPIWPATLSPRLAMASARPATASARPATVSARPATARRAPATATGTLSECSFGARETVSRRGAASARAVLAGSRSPRAAAAAAAAAMECALPLQSQRLLGRQQAEYVDRGSPDEQLKRHLALSYKHGIMPARERDGILKVPSPHLFVRSEEQNVSVHEEEAKCSACSSVLSLAKKQNSDMLVCAGVTAAFAG